MAPRTRSTTKGSQGLALHEISGPAGNVIGNKQQVPTAKAMIASPSSVSSAVLTPATNYSSGSEYSTPLTSHVPTPVASDPTAESANISAPKKGTRIEVLLPQSKAHPDSHRALQQSIYAMKSKRKRPGLDESDDEYEADTGPDAKLARKLQEEEDELAAKELVGIASHVPGQTPFRRSSRNLAASTSKNPVSFFDTENDEDAELGNGLYTSVKPAIAAKGKGKERTVPLKKPINIVASDDDEDFDDHELDMDVSDDDIPLSKAAKTPRRRTTRINKKSTTSSDANEGDSISDTALSSVDDSESESEFSDEGSDIEEDDNSGNDVDTNVDQTQPSVQPTAMLNLPPSRARSFRRHRARRHDRGFQNDLEDNHPELLTMWDELKNISILKTGKAEQPKNISRQLKPFQLEGLAWMKEMEKFHWKGGVLGDEMGLGKTIQAVSLIMSDWPAKLPSLVLVPPVAMMQWMAEINSYTDGTLKTLFFHGTNSKAKNLTVKDLKQYNVVIMSYNSLEAMYRKQVKGFKRKDGLYKEQSIIHQTKFHRVILDEAHSIKSRTTMTAKACFALNATYRWCLSGTPLQNRIGEFFSLVRFLNIHPFASYFCRRCPCSSLEWTMDDSSRCTQCNHVGMAHVSLFNRELLNPIQKFGNVGPGAEAFRKLRILTDRIMLRRLKKDHTNSMELPVKEIYVDRQFFGEEETDFANSIMRSGQRRFNTYVAEGVMLHNYANIFGLIMQMRQVADHPDLILRKNSAGGQNILGCCICDEPAEEAIRSRCKHDFCRACARAYLLSSDQPDCPRCHIPLSIDLEQPEIEQDGEQIKKSSIINRINMENWTSSSKIELLVHELHKLRSDNASHKSIIFSQFTTMLQLIEWRLRRAGITTVMLDGSMTPAQRQASIDHFMKNVDVECFLVSLKAGGVALNLTEASRVFIVDPWWNPAAEWQSADRCHRIGQTRPCTITRLCIEDSVESRMVLLQEKKTNMINSTINADDAAMESLTPADLVFLFQGN